MGYAAEIAKTIATSGGIEAVARAMTIHVNSNDVQVHAVGAICILVGGVPARIAMAKTAGMVPLLERAAAQGSQHASNQLKRMGNLIGWN